MDEHWVLINPGTLGFCLDDQKRYRFGAFRGRAVRADYVRKTVTMQIVTINGVRLYEIAQADCSIDPPLPGPPPESYGGWS